mmetsp:Transcript_25257/g.79753  ORF Transcript_25257/g.79753 Transcript_25257/m.79753 type:complete len:345 (+) Transcript_25257:1880-2914(+)
MARHSPDTAEGWPPAPKAKALRAAEARERGRDGPSAALPNRRAQKMPHSCATARSACAEGRASSAPCSNAPSWDCEPKATNCAVTSCRHTGPAASHATAAADGASAGSESTAIASLAVSSSLLLSPAAASAWLTRASGQARSALAGLGASSAKAMAGSIACSSAASGAAPPPPGSSGEVTEATAALSAARLPATHMLSGGDTPSTDAPLSNGRQPPRDTGIARAAHHGGVQESSDASVAADAASVEAKRANGPANAVATLGRGRRETIPGAPRNSRAKTAAAAAAAGEAGCGSRQSAEGTGLCPSHDGVVAVAPGVPPLLSEREITELQADRARNLVQASATRR